MTDTGGVPTSAGLVAALVAEQFPHWADRPVRPVTATGINHASYRLGDDLLVRLPRTRAVAEIGTVEDRWLPVLAPHLPVAVPRPIARGEPGRGYPFPWTVARWIEGTSVAEEPSVVGVPLAEAVAAFLLALRAVDSHGGPPPGRRNDSRGASAATLGPTLAGADQLVDELDLAAVRRVGAEAMAAPPWADPPTWLHGDLHGGNLLVDHGRLVGVIDWSLLAVGDPAIDLLPAWTVFDRATRPAFRAAVGADEPSWSRARGWALATAVRGMALHDARPAFQAQCRDLLAEVLAD